MATQKTRQSQAEGPALGRVDGREVRTRRGTERAKQILSVAETLFHKQGYAQTSMDDIARSTGLLKGSLYYYVDTKEDLLYHIVQDVHDVSHSQLESTRSREDLSALERLLHFVEAQVLYNARNVTRVAVYHHEWHRLDGDRLKSVRSRRHEYDANLMALIDEAKLAGQIPSDVDTALSANTILAVICWPYTWYRPAALPPQQLANFCTEFVRAGLKAS